MKTIIFISLFLVSLSAYSQSDTLSYKVTSVYDNGGKRTDLVELVDGYIVNAYYADGIHYYWSKRLDVNKKEKKLYEFSYSENYNFNSDLTIKVSEASYTETVYTGGAYGSFTTVTTTNSKPRYELIKTIKVLKDKYLVYTYAGGELYWTYCYDSNGVIMYGINEGNKWTYKIKGKTMIETSPKGKIKEYEIDNEGIARCQDGEGLESWVRAEYGRINTIIKIPPYIDKK